MTATKLNVSIATFNEIANALEQKGLKLSKDDTIILGKDISLQPPIDYRLVTIRRDCVTEAAKVSDGSGDFIELVDKIYQFVLYGKKEDKLIEKASSILKQDNKFVIREMKEGWK